MKRITTIFVLCISIALLIAGCGSQVDNKKFTLDKKHQPLPDYVLNAPEKVQQTYVIASEYPAVLGNVPCYCGCGINNGHKSNLDCFVGQFGNDNAVEAWDSMGVS